jgi:hypothetical protein
MLNGFKSLFNNNNTKKIKKEINEENQKNLIKYKRELKKIVNNYFKTHEYNSKMENIYNNHIENYKYLKNLEAKFKLNATLLSKQKINQKEYNKRFIKFEKNNKGNYNYLLKRLKNSRRIINRKNLYKKGVDEIKKYNNELTEIFKHFPQKYNGEKSNLIHSFSLLKDMEVNNKLKKKQLNRGNINQEEYNKRLKELKERRNNLLTKSNISQLREKYNNLYKDLRKKEHEKKRIYEEKRLKNAEEERERQIKAKIAYNREIGMFMTQKNFQIEAEKSQENEKKRIQAEEAYYREKTMGIPKLTENNKQKMKNKEQKMKNNEEIYLRRVDS